MEYKDTHPWGCALGLVPLYSMQHEVAVLNVLYITLCKIHSP